MMAMEVRMKKNFRRRFWVETVLASIVGILCVITPIWPDWIEILSGWDPDQHDGSVEWYIAGGLLFVAATMFAAAAIEWRRTPVGGNILVGSTG
jgi:hypothetical protein